VDVCYNKLFKLLIDKGMKKTELRLATGISPNTLTKLSNNEYVSMEVLVKICRVLHCDVGDIMEVIESPENGTDTLV
jgi:putative transcriptional regulator